MAPLGTKPRRKGFTGDNEAGSYGEPALTAAELENGETPLVVGLTGGIASGKTTVSGLLAARGAYIIDADGVGHQVLLPDGEAYPQVVATFGTEILEQDGTVSRPKLGAIVFSDPERLAALNAISHPAMAGRMSLEIRRVRAKPPAERPPLIVLDAAILFEAGWDALCAQVWTVEAPPEATVERLTAGGRFTRQAAQARIDAQLSNAERAQRAGRVILNTGSLAALEAEVRRVWESAVETTGEAE